MLNYLTDEEKDRLYVACPDIYGKLAEIDTITRALKYGDEKTLHNVSVYARAAVKDPDFLKTMRLAEKQHKARRKESVNED